MKQTWMTGALVVAAALTVTSIHIALANTYDCDNDRASSQYPHCFNSQSPSTNTATVGWSYRSGFSGDWNGDDRLSYSSDPSFGPEYSWNFSGLNNGSIRIDAWLANAAFIDPHANYKVRVAPGTSDGVSRAINQNTAPSGWNTIVVTTTSSSPIISVQQSATGTHAGADLIRITTGIATSSAMDAVVDDAMADARDPASCGVTTTMTAGAGAIQQRMLNAVDTYRDVTGSYRIVFQNNGQDDTVAFEISESSPGSFVTTTNRSGRVAEHRSDGARLAIIDPISGAQRVGQVASAASLTVPRQYFNRSCEPVFIHRQDPAAADAASDVVLPQNYAFWLSDSGARVAGSDRILGRSATVIEGRHTDYLAGKLGATAFKMWVDDETGTLLKLTGSDERGAVVYFIDVQAIQFNAGVDRRHFTIPAATTGAE